MALTYGALRPMPETSRSRLWLPDSWLPKTLSQKLSRSWRNGVFSALPVTLSGEPGSLAMRWSCKDGFGGRVGAASAKTEDGGAAWSPGIWTLPAVMGVTGRPATEGTPKGEAIVVGNTGPVGINIAPPGPEATGEMPRAPLIMAICIMSANIAKSRGPGARPDGACRFDTARTALKQCVQVVPP